MASVKELTAFAVLEMTGDPTICHDDKLLLRGQKSVVGLEADWRSVALPVRRNGHKVVVNFSQRSADGSVVDTISHDQWSELKPLQRSLYRPQYLRGIDLGDGASLSMRNNEFDLRLANLFGNYRSRYRSALDALVELQERGVLTYAPRTDEPTERNRLEAMRNRLKRTMKPTEYEHDILLPGDLGKAIWGDLRRSEKVSRVTEGTIYVKGYQRYKGIQSAVKCYDIGMRDGLDAGRWYKLETTLYKAYFKGQNIGVGELVEQPDIQERISERLTRDVAGAIKLLSGETMEMLQAELGLTSGRAERQHTDVARAMLRRGGTLTERVRDLERAKIEHDHEIAEVKRRLDKLERLRASQSGHY